MSSQSQLQEEQITTKMVADFLRNHPEFFVEQPDLLADFRIPHPTGSAVSLIERQVSVLRDQNARLKRKLMDLVQVGEDNGRLTDRIHQLALALLESNTLGDVVNVLHEHLQNHFSADVFSIHLKNLSEAATHKGPVQAIHSNDPILKGHEKAFKECRPVCGSLNEAQKQHVFGHSDVKVQSVAVVPLAKDRLTGYLGLGSRNPDQFHGSKDTLFLRYLGRLVSHALLRVQQTTAPSQ
ncbi:MAG: DUF484 family protein [Gammaproteobacteria bacterium]